MKKTLSKTEAKKQIEEFFKDVKNKTPKEVKKIKRFAMRYNLPLKELRKKFCKRCLTPYKNPKIRMKKNIKIITCGDCGAISRWKINSS